MSETDTTAPPAAEEKYVPQNVLSSEPNEDASKPLQQPLRFGDIRPSALTPLEAIE